MASEPASGKSMLMAQPKSPGLSISSPKQRSMWLAQIGLRVSAIAFTLAGIAVLITSSQSVVVFGIDFDARYNYSSSLKYLLAIDAEVCISSVLSLIFAFFLCRSNSHVKKYFLLFLHDMGTMVMMMSGCAAATAVGYVSTFGEEKMGWVAVCINVGKFCNQVMVSIVFSYLAFFSYLSLTIMSTKKLISRAAEEGTRDQNC